MNDTPTIGGIDTGAVTEDVPLDASGTLTVSDPDPGESNFIAEAIAGGYGTLIIDAERWRPKNIRLPRARRNT